MRLAGAAAKIVMHEWGTRMMKIFEENKIDVALAACYVDDTRFLTNVLEKGCRWDKKEKRFMYMEKWRQEDEEENQEDNIRHAREIKQAMNSIFKDIQFETEIPEDFANKRLPTLDFEMWLGPPRVAHTSHLGQNHENPKRPVSSNIDDPPKAVGNNAPKIYYTFYEKPMASPFSVMERSALPENTKISTLTQDLVRRMLNTSELISQGERNLVIENYIIKLTRSGYSKVQFKRIVISGLKGYENKKEL